MKKKVTTTVLRAVRGNRLSVVAGRLIRWELSFRRPMQFSHRAPGFRGAKIWRLGSSPS